MYIEYSHDRRIEYLHQTMKMCKFWLKSNPNSLEDSKPQTHGKFKNSKKETEIWFENSYSATHTTQTILCSIE